MKNTENYKKKIILDSWLSKIIEKPVFFLKSFSKDIKKKDLPKGKSFIWSRIPVDDTEALIILKKLGFYSIETNMQFNLSKKIISKKNPKIRFAKSTDETNLRALAKNAFTNNRFYNDLNITKKIACKIKEEWVGNFFSGNRGRWMIVAEKNSKLVGFLQLIYKNKKTIIIDLIAVDKKYRGKGFAKDMIAYAYAECLKNSGTIKVGTQLNNTESIKLYLKLGFNLKRAYNILHLHK